MTVSADDRSKPTTNSETFRRRSTRRKNGERNGHTRYANAISVVGGEKMPSQPHPVFFRSANRFRRFYYIRTMSLPLETVQRRGVLTKGGRKDFSTTNGTRRSHARRFKACTPVLNSNRRRLTPLSRFGFRKRLRWMCKTATSNRLTKRTRINAGDPCAGVSQHCTKRNRLKHVFVRRPFSTKRVFRLRKTGVGSRLARAPL